MTEETTKKEPESDPAKVRAAALLALVAAVAVFTALGIEGETLRRAVRNDPYGTAWPIALVIFGLSAPLLHLALTKAWAPFAKPRKTTPPTDSRTRLLGRVLFMFTPSLLVFGGLVWLVFVGAKSLNEREMPTLSAVASKINDSTVNIKYKAVAPSLRSDETILLRVVAFTSEVQGDALARLCMDAKVIRPSTDEETSELKVRRILHWGESGPNKAGEATVTADVSASTSEFRYVCAYTRLFNVVGEESRDDKKPYFAWSVTDLRNPLDEAHPSPSTTTAPPSPPSPNGLPLGGTPPATTGGLVPSAESCALRARQHLSP